MSKRPGFALPDDGVGPPLGDDLHALAAANLEPELSRGVIVPTVFTNRRLKYIVLCKYIKEVVEWPRTQSRLRR